MPHEVMLTVGVILLVSLCADWIGRRTPLPRVTLLVLVGVLVGPSGLGWIPETMHDASELITAFALTMVAFLLGSELSREKLAEHGKGIVSYSVAVVIATWALVAFGLWIFGAPPVMAILLGAIATATDPAATADVLGEPGRDGRYKGLVLGIVAIDDAWGLIIFGIAMGIAVAFSGHGGGEVVNELTIELGGALAIGAAIGVPMAFFSGRMKPGQPTQLEAIGLVLVCGGLAIWFEASYLLAATTAGAIVANLATHHEHTFREIEHFEWPFITVFFVLAGAMLDPQAAMAAGVMGVCYLVFRVLGRVVGGLAGGVAVGEPSAQGFWVGLGLLPQAGVAVGMGLVAANDFPAYGETILAITLGGTVVFELVGPVLTRIAHKKAGANGAASGGSPDA